MRKKITSILSLLLFFSMTASADSQSLADVSDIPVTEIEAGKLYAIETHGQAGQTYWMYDAGANIGASEITDGVEGMKFVWTFIQDGDTYAIQNVSTGNYISIDGTSNGGATSMKATASPITIVFSGESCAFKNASGQCIDMSWEGNKPSTWKDNVDVAGSRVMTIYEVTTESVGDEEVYVAKLASLCEKYGNRVPGYQADAEPFEIGSEIGQYNVSEEVYNTFIENMNKAVQIILAEIDVPSIEEMQAIIDAVETSHQAILDAFVELTIADGNYRIVSAFEWTKTINTPTGEVDENEQPIYDTTYEYPKKAIYATMENEVKWATLDSTSCEFLWKLTNNPETGFIQIKNIATTGVIADCSQSKRATINPDSKTEFFFLYEGRDEQGNIKVAMRPSTRGNYGFLHTDGHYNGAGEQGFIVGWEPTAGATQWILCPVEDEVVAELEEAYLPIRNHELLVSMFEELIEKSDSLVEVATDMTKTPLITSAGQLSSEFSDPTEGSDIAALIDGNKGTYWHTTWQNGSLEPGSHYFYAQMEEAVTGDMMITITRRNNASNDHVSKIDVYAGTSEDDLQLVAQLNFPYSAAGETVSSELFTLDGSYSYFKYVVTETSPTSNNRGYFHMAEFQMTAISENPNNQLVGMGETGTALINAIETAKAVDVDELTIDDYNELKAAYDAVMALYVDPSALRDAIAENRGFATNIVIGENPGFWSNDSEAATFAALLSEAEAYDKAGIYTKAQSEEFIKRIEAGVADIMASANPIEAGKWYTIRFCGEEMYDTYKWNKNNAVNTTLGDLYDNYLAPAIVEEDALVPFETLEEVTEGKTLRFINEDIITSMDQVAFRFLPYEDGFVLQHMSGLFVQGAGAGNQITLGLTPAIFDVRAAGLGKVLIHTRKINGEEYGNEIVFLHAQNAGHSLVTWMSPEAGSNSALFLEAIDESDLDNSDVAEAFIRMVKPNSMRIWCYPVQYTVSEGQLYEYQGAWDDEEGWHLAFREAEFAEAGKPMLYVNGNIDDFDAENDEMVEEYITIEPTNISPEVKNYMGMHGTYTYHWVDEGTIVVGGGQIAQWGNCLEAAAGENNTDCTRDISANTGYIYAAEWPIAGAEYDLVLTISGDDQMTAVNGIEQALKGNADAIFNLAGQRVVKAQKGIFIMGGKKVAVK